MIVDLIRLLQGVLFFSKSFNLTSDIFLMDIPLDLKLVSVKFAGLGLALPTLSLGFWK